MLSIFKTAAAGGNLSPQARAFLRFVDGLVAAGIVGAITVVAPLLMSHDPASINWVATGQYALAGFAVGVLLTIKKYAQAKGDTPLADAIGQVADAVRQWSGISSSVKFEPPPDPMAPPTADPGALGASSPLAAALAASATPDPASPAH